MALSSSRAFDVAAARVVALGCWCNSPAMPRWTETAVLQRLRHIGAPKVPRCKVETSKATACTVNPWSWPALDLRSMVVVVRRTFMAHDSRSPHSIDRASWYICGSACVGRVRRSPRSRLIPKYLLMQV